LTIAEYTKAGVPSLEKPWSAKEAATAVDVLNKIAMNDPRQLPRYQSPRSGALFARLASCVALEPVGAEKGTVVERMRVAAQWMRTGQDILKLYLQAMGQKAVSGDEFGEVMSAQLRGSVLVIGLTNELLPTLDKKDPTYQNRMAGVVQARFGLAIVHEGAIMSLQERENYSLAQRRRLLSSLKETGPRIFPFLAPESQTTLIQRLEAVRVDEKSADLKPGVEELLAKLKASAKPAKP
jgi:hypothetical protein